MKSRAVAFLVLALFLGASVRAATPPTLVNYQGVLRDASDKPRNGTFNMTFHFFDAAIAGSEILVDAHTGGGGIVVTGGLFNVALGSGTLTDGSGPGTYSSLDQVFRDFSAVWMEVQVGAETLSPRIRVQAEPYAMNASNLEGKPAANFIDTSGGSQTKSGHFIGNGGLEGNNSVFSGVGVQGTGGGAGGVFADSSIVAVSHLGYNYFDGISHYFYGVHGSGTTAGGWFQNPSSGTSAQLAYGYMGGYFSNASGDYAEAAPLGDGLVASGSSIGVYGFGPTGVYGSGGTGISGYGTSKGGSFSTSSSSADLATGAYGVYANGSSTGGFFYNSSSGQAFLATGNYGIYAYGSNYGGYFYDTDSSGVASVGSGDLGIDAQGLQAGGHFRKSGTTAEAYLGAGDIFGNQDGVYGLSSGFGEAPGFFWNQYTGNYTYVGSSTYKVYGNGSVSFVQNDPSDASRMIQYTAPEGDETAVYTRGTARLEGGVAHVKLGETFAWVANPDTGLTAQLTPHGVAVPLAVESLTTSELAVRGPATGPQNLTFDYTVWGLRIGFEDRAVVRPKREEAFIPSAELDDALYAEHPDLKAFASRARFARMEAAADPQRAASRTDAASTALKAAIHVYNRAEDLPKLPQAAPSPSRAALPMESSASASATSAPRDSSGAPPLAARSPESSGPLPGETAGAPQAGTSATPPLLPLRLPDPIFTASECVEPGDLVALDPAHPGRLARAASPALIDVIGVVVSALPCRDESADNVILADGRFARIKADAAYGVIQPGDPLTASPTPGHLRRADPRGPGTVLGKALEGLDAGTGLITVLLVTR
jgi:hypothetical protein